MTPGRGGLLQKNEKMLGRGISQPALSRFPGKKKAPAPAAETRETLQAPAEFTEVDETALDERERKGEK